MDFGLERGRRDAGCVFRVPMVVGESISNGPSTISINPATVTTANRSLGCKNHLSANETLLGINRYSILTVRPGLSGVLDV